ncbi:MAG: cellulose biosynthesis protein BcsG [Nitrospirae bacterium]|nr:cellulose biosynthesis protein BcsG [Nitrospirota bacterium]
MGAWNFYFLAKLYLYFRGYLRLDFVLNLLFIIFLVIPVPAQLKSYRSLTVVKHGFSGVLGLLLLWHDSWLPPLGVALSFVGQGGMPSKEYVYRFLLEFVNLREVAAVVSILALGILVRNRIRLTPVVLLLLVIVPLREFGQHPGGIEGEVRAFYRSESSRVVHFEKSNTKAPDFDIIILHVCSLSWDDLRGVGMEADPFFKTFDVLFTDFNSVTTYSNPSAIRLLRANCGQSSHDALYHEAPRDCYLVESLRDQGFETTFTLNHDGVYGHFADQVKALGHLDTPLLPIDLPIQAYDFDGSAIYNDYAVLEKWWALRQQSPSTAAAVYYNTISLHDGAHWVGEKEWWKRDRTVYYREAAQKLLGDVARFFDLVASSGRKAVIVFVPEHGMALRGNVLQVAGLRDIPFKPITQVPVGIKFIGRNPGRGDIPQRVISKPTSYLALSYLMASFMERSPFESDGSESDDRIAHLPETDFVAENQEIRIAKKGAEYFLYGKEKKWIALPSIAVPQTGGT